MKNIDKFSTIKRYKKRLKTFGNNVRALATGNKKRRLIRYQVITEVGIKTGDKVLDVGCGLAKYYEYLNNRGIKVKYTGIDISKDLIRESKKKYPKIKFYVRDLEVFPFRKNSFDYAIASQVFNHKLKSKTNLNLSKRMIKIMYNISRKGVAIDFLTKYVDYRERRHFHYSPEELFSFAKKISNRVLVRHDYPLYEFCMYIYPSFKNWKKHEK